jgi:hypothetical protein
MSKLNYHILVEPISAEVFQQISFENGSFYHGSIGHIELEPGTLVSLTHGQEFLNYTRSGKAYESEFPYGKIIAFAIPASVVLQKNDPEKLTTMIFEKNDAEKLIEQQKISYLPQIESLKASFSQKYLEQQKKDAELHIQREKNQREIVAKAFAEIEKAFSKTKSSSSPKIK